MDSEYIISFPVASINQINSDMVAPSPEEITISQVAYDEKMVKLHILYPYHYSNTDVIQLKEAL